MRPATTSRRSCCGPEGGRAGHAAGRPQRRDRVADRLSPDATLIARWAAPRGQQRGVLATSSALAQQPCDVGPQPRRQPARAGCERLAYCRRETGHQRTVTGTGDAGGWFRNMARAANLRLRDCRFESCRAYHTGARVWPRNRGFDAIWVQGGGQCATQCATASFTTWHDLAQRGTTGEAGLLGREVGSAGLSCSCRTWPAGTSGGRRRAWCHGSAGRSRQPKCQGPRRG